MFQQLDYNQQQTVLRVVELITADSELNDELRTLSCILNGTPSHKQHSALLGDLMAYILDNNEGVADEAEIHDTLPCIKRAMLFTLNSFNDYIKFGDRLFTDEDKHLHTKKKQAVLNTCVTHELADYPDTPDVTFANWYDRAVVDNPMSCCETPLKFTLKDPSMPLHLALELALTTLYEEEENAEI